MLGPTHLELSFSSFIQRFRILLLYFPLIVHQINAPTITIASNASKKITNIFNSSWGTSLHSTSKNISLLITLLLFVSCSSNKPGKNETFPRQAENIRDFSRDESEPIPLDGFYKSKGYEPINLFKLDYWKKQNFQLAYLAWQRNCTSRRVPIEIFIKCKTHPKIDSANADMIRKFFEDNFKTYTLRAGAGTLTAYYEPILRGSRMKTKQYYSPIFRLPPGFLTITERKKDGTNSVIPSLKRKREPSVPPNQYPTRKQIMEKELLKGNELLFLENSVENFFLHIQGSGTIELDNGKRIRVGFAGSNGRPYRSIAKWLEAEGEMPLNKASMRNIKNWVKQNPLKSSDLFNYNPRFIFFREFPASSDPSEGPVGTLGVPLTADHSIAVDEAFIKLGTPVMVVEEKESQNVNPRTFLMMAQDTGNAIKGANRGDLFFGTGTTAGNRAGTTKFRGRLIIFLPK